MIRKVLIALLFCLPLIILVPHLDQFVFQPGSQYSDIAVSHYPNGIYLQNAVRERGVIPMWSDSILSGYPFAANPLSGLHYPPGWLALLFPLPLGFNLVLLLHILFGGIGTYCLLRKEGAAQPAALLGALAFESLPKVYAHLAAGHMTILYAFCWTPWLLFVEGHAWRRKILGYLVPGAVLGIIALADIRWAAYAGFLWAAFSLRHLAARVRLGEIKSKFLGGEIFNWAAMFTANIMITGLISAPLI
ncbi:MAG: hypothetical protein IH586_13790, partial [Anaerolineaceae bacterium]|nr:hypothetical protein [Anaerolineaceae bacterium]